MDNEASQTADLYYLAAWAHANRKRLTSISIGVVAFAAIVGGYFWYQNSRETTASEALCNIKQAQTAAVVPLPTDAQPYLKLAEEYSGTGAAARALLIAGGIEFDTGKFADAQKTFDDFMKDYASNPLANQAMLGVAASLEAQGKIKEATSRYEDMVKRRAVDSTTPQAKSALARLYVAQNKPELAMQQYEELLKSGNNDSWSAEAKVHLDELLIQFPNLRTPPTPAPAPVSTMPSPSTSTAAAPTTAPKAAAPTTNSPAQKTSAP